MYSNLSHFFTWKRSIFFAHFETYNTTLLSIFTLLWNKIPELLVVFFFLLWKFGVCIKASLILFKYFTLWGPGSYCRLFGIKTSQALWSYVLNSNFLRSTQNHSGIYLLFSFILYIRAYCVQKHLCAEELCGVCSCLPPLHGFWLLNLGSQSSTAKTFTK